MKAQMMTGFFSYKPCELSVSGSSLIVGFPPAGKTISITGIKSAALSRIHGGTRHLALSAADGQYEFMLSDDKTGEAAALMLYELTKESARLELRTQD